MIVWKNAKSDQKAVSISGSGLGAQKTVDLITDASSKTRAKKYRDEARAKITADAPG
jgi:hypothetical protein